MKNMALIPARAGSKRIKDKNITMLGKKPLIAYSIHSAIQSEIFDRIVVTTDCAKVAKMSESCGAEVPFLRPKVLATDTSLDKDYIVHALDWLECNNNYTPDMVSILRPTTPIRKPEVIKKAVDKFFKVYDASTSLRSVHELAEPPQKMLQIHGDFLTGFFPDDERNEYFNLPRQAFHKAYYPNGYIDIVKPDHIRNSSQGIFGDKMSYVITDFVVEIDLPQDLQYLEFMLNHYESTRVES